MKWDVIVKIILAVTAILLMIAIVKGLLNSFLS